MISDTSLSLLTNWLGSFTMVLIVGYHVRYCTDQALAVSAHRQADAVSARTVNAN